ncbi:hypothetical protein GGI35DRAFT_388627 [Trichoderma velutinum]
MTLQTSLGFFSPRGKTRALCLLPRIYLAWRGTSGCSINITSGPRRHMTPKWAFQRRVDGILRFAMSPTACCSQGQSDPAHRCSQQCCTEDTWMCEHIDDGGKGSSASKELRIRASLVPPLAGNSCTSWALLPPFKPDPWLANHVQQRTPAFSYQLPSLLRGIVATCAMG